MNVICFGDSNTYGYDPRSWLGDRYDPQNRWVDILAGKTGWNISNRGQNGREIPRQPVSFPADTGLLVVMLGTNDLLQGRTPSETAQRMLRFLAGLTVEHDKILFIAPPPVAFGAWVQEQRLIEASAELAVQYRALADDAHPHQRQHHGNEHAEDAERAADQLFAEPGTRTSAEVFDRVVVERAVAADTLQHAQVGRPAEVVEDDRRRGEEPREKEQQTQRPAGAVAVRAGGLRTIGGGGILGCHGNCA